LVLVMEKEVVVDEKRVGIWRRWLLL